MKFDLSYISNGEGVPFVFQHGLGGSLQQAVGIMSNLENVQLISMDCPGHGESLLDRSKLPCFDNYSDELIHLLDYLKIEKAIFGGISMGSGIALNIALRYKERVGGLILVRPAWLDRPFPPNLDILLEVAKYAEKEDGKAQFEATPIFQAIHAVLPKAAASILGQFNRAQGKYTPLVLRQMVGDKPFPDLSALKRVTQPCLVLANEQDPLHPFSFGEKINGALPNSKLVKITSRYLDNEAYELAVCENARKFIANYQLP